jgi:hypothetical protein
MAGVVSVAVGVAVAGGTVCVAVGVATGSCLRAKPTSTVVSGPRPAPHCRG